MSRTTKRERFDGKRDETASKQAQTGHAGGGVTTRTPPGADLPAN
jgi:hypothetical protein